MAKNLLSDRAVRDLTQNQRDLIVSHVDGPVDCTVHNRHLVQVRDSIIRMGLLAGNGGKRPRKTELTDRGREALGFILGWYADALVKAGFIDGRGESPLQVLARLKSELGFQLAAPKISGSGEHFLVD